MPMKNYDSMKGHDAEACPVHDAPATKSYDFGMGDAEVVKFRCGCFACFVGDSLDDDGTYHTDWGSAQGRARFAVAKASTW